MAITRSKCGRDTHHKAPPKAAPKNAATSARAAGKQPAPKKRSAAKGAAVPKKRLIPKNDKERAWQLQLILGFEERPGPRDLPTDKNNELRKLFAELDQLHETHPTLKRETQLWL